MTKPAKKGLLGGVELIGISLSDFGKDLFGGTHMAGGAILRAFGAGSTADKLEHIEKNAGLLPDWAQAPSPVTKVAVATPDFVMVVPLSSPATGKVGKTAIFAADLVVVYGGARFDGNGYKTGDGFASKKYTFGYHTPSKIIASYQGQPPVVYDGIAQVLFLGGTEGQPVTSTGDNTTQDIVDAAGQVVKVAATYGAAAKAASAGAAKATPSSSSPAPASSSMQLSQPALSVAQAQPAPSSSSPSVANYQLTAPTLSGDALGRQIVGELEAAESVGMSFTDVLENVFTGGAVYTSQAAEKGLFGSGGGGAGPVNYNFNTDASKYHPQYKASPALAQALATAQQKLAQVRAQQAAASVAATAAALASVQSNSSSTSSAALPSATAATSGDGGDGSGTTNDQGVIAMGISDDENDGFGTPYEVEIGSDGRPKRGFIRRGLEVLGLVPPPRPIFKPAGTQGGISILRAPLTGRTFTALSLPAKSHSPAAAIAAARAAGNRAISIAQKLQAAAAKLGRKVIVGSDGGSWVELIGANTAIRRPPVKLTAAALTKLANDTAKLGHGTLDAASKHEKLVKASGVKLQAGVKKVQAITNPRASISIKGDHHVIGAAVLDLAARKSFAKRLGDAFARHPIIGQMTDPTIDPTTGLPYASGSTDGSTTDGSGSALPGPPDYGLPPPPTSAPALVPGQDYTPDPNPGGKNDYTVYSSTGSGVPLPIGAVIYQDDGSHSMGAKSVGSYGYFNQGVPGVKSRDGAGSGYIVRSVRNGQLHYVAYVKSAHVDNDKALRSDEAQDLPTMARNSVANGWGSLIGNPASWTKGLLYDTGGNQWFWYYDDAPPWATAADTMTRFNQAVVDSKTQLTTAAANYAAQQAQDQLDATNADALAKSQAIEDSQAQHQADLAAIAQPQQQAQQDAAYQAAALQDAQNQAQADQAYQAAQTSLLQNHPELWVQAQQAQQGGGGQDDGSGGNSDGAYGSDSGGDWQDQLNSSLDSASGDDNNFDQMPDDGIEGLGRTSKRY